MSQATRRASKLEYESTAQILVDPEADWMEYANCRSSDPAVLSMFFPSKEGGRMSGGDRENANRVRAICNDCDVKVECLRYAVVNDIRHGYWGGMSRVERYRDGARIRLLRKFAS